MPAHHFVSIDVETANSWFGSICQIGLVEFSDGQVINEWQTLVNPECEFQDFNVRLHKIEPYHVTDAPLFPAALKDVCSLVGDTLVASYGHFDRSAFGQACDTRGLERISNPWLNIHPVVKRAWPDKYAEGGFRLNSVCKYLGIPLPRHHNAVDDARAAGMILLKAAEVTGIPPDDWVARNRRPIRSQNLPEMEIVVNPDGPLCGEIIVFTGAMQMPRQQAQALSAALGCTPNNGVTKKTTILVVGDQDLTKLAGKDKSSKHVKAEELIAAGHDIRIIGESDFQAMVALDEADNS